MPENSGIEFWTTHGLDKVFLDTVRPPQARREISLHVARSEVEDAQVAVRIPKDLEIRHADFALNDLAGPGSARIDRGCLEAHWVWNTYVVHNPPQNSDPATCLRKAPAFFPDGFLEQQTIRILGGRTQALWVSVRVPPDARPGIYQGEVRIHLEAWEGQKTLLEVPLSVEVWPFELPRENRLRHTEWFLQEPLTAYYRLEPWSEAHWGWIERVARDMGRHRQDMIFTPFSDFLGCPGLVTVVRRGDGSFSFDFSRLDRWIDIFAREGVTWIEGAHVAERLGEWESEFVLKRFGVKNESGADLCTSREVMPEEEFEPVVEALLKGCHEHLKSLGAHERYVQHVADEPVAKNEASWCRISSKVKSWLPGVPRIDAVMTQGLEGLVDIRVPKISELPEPSARASTEQLWCYVCLEPQGYYPNRFLDYQSIRNRIMFWLCWTLGLKGFLHWGYNFWIAWVGCPAPVHVSPWMDAAGGSHYLPDKWPMPAGDPFLVYPGERDICSSIRWEVIRKGIEDFEYLSMLEELAGEAAPGPARSQAEALLERVRTLIAPDALSYTWDDALLLRTRKEIGQAICELMAAR